VITVMLGMNGGEYRPFETDLFSKFILKTPMSTQAQTVLNLTYRHNHLRLARVTMVENALKEYRPTKLEAAIDAMDSLREEIVSLQRAAAAFLTMVVLFPYLEVPGLGELSEKIQIDPLPKSVWRRLRRKTS